MRKNLPFLFILFFVLACSPGSGPLTDIIPVQSVFSGDSLILQVQDLFYAEDYTSLEFGEHPHLDVRGTPDSEIRILKADKAYSGFALLPFRFSGGSYVLPLRVTQRRDVTFRYAADPGVEKVTVFGNFNFWDREKYSLEKLQNGDFTLTLPFEPGQYEYLFRVDGREILDPQNPVSVPNGLGGFNSALKVLPLFEGTRPFITPLDFRSGNFLSLHFRLLPQDYTGAFRARDLKVLLDNRRLPKYRIRLKDKIITVRIPREQGEAAKRLRLMWSSGECNSNVAEVILENGAPAGNHGAFKWQDAILYSLMPDRFYDGDPSNNKPIIHGELAERANFRGGDLYGIIKKLDEGYFNDLGVNTLWILPFIRNTDKPFRETPPPHRMFSAYHGYWPVAAREVDPHFGDLDAVRTLVDVAHKQDIRILMDFVSNHVHQEHPYYQKHPEWFGQYELPDGRENLRLFDEYRLTTWFESYLPSFDYPAAPEAVDTVVADAIWWLKALNLDGFRHDAVKHVPHLFWRQLTREIRRNFPDKDLYQIGETFGDHALIHAYVNQGQLSAQFNFNLYWPARYAFAEDASNFEPLAAEMERVIDIYGQLHLMANLMDSHDQPRYPAYLEKDLDWSENAQEVGWHRDIRVDDPQTYEKVAMYMTYLMSIPGPPVLYYGNEIGMSGAGDPDNRRMMLWKITREQRELRDKISALTTLRREHSALRYGDYLTLRADKDVYAFLRSDFNERIITVIYRNGRPGSIVLPLPEALGIRGLRCLNTQADFKLNNGQLILEAKAYSGYVFQAEDR
ncbi:MAG: alpha-amylase family glycosyl hydrolase [Candidatus Neomarinimicrobiota bacterium]|jgi:glycosidase|nr:alpha-amylase family glycosyl hydrolase [Candidatus Neomarinimicrobiota bacterium]MDD3966809.1 alpha-amylase family glycosyl hydrolase [Candidatus Neomarinimicrobiota bacterium]MDX9780949.1 alpha-amylase family glycosyl hydrolase [bacterium]